MKSKGVLAKPTHVNMYARSQFSSRGSLLSTDSATVRLQHPPRAAPRHHGRAARHDPRAHQGVARRSRRGALRLNGPLFGLIFLCLRNGTDWCRTRSNAARDDPGRGRGPQGCRRARHRPVEHPLDCPDQDSVAHLSPSKYLTVQTQSQSVSLVVVRQRGECSVRSVSACQLADATRLRRSDECAPPVVARHEDRLLSHFTCCPRRPLSSSLSLAVALAGTGSLGWLGQPTRTHARPAGGQAQPVLAPLPGAPLLIFISLRAPHLAHRPLTPHATRRSASSSSSGSRASSSRPPRARASSTSAA